MNKINEELQQENGAAPQLHPFQIKPQGEPVGPGHTVESPEGTDNMTTEGPKADFRSDREKGAEILERQLEEEVAANAVLQELEQNRAQREMMRKVRQRKGQVEGDKERQMPRWMVRTFKILGWASAVLGFLALLAYSAWLDRDKFVQAREKYGSHETQCVFKVGERTLHGTREYSYQYYTVLNWTFRDTRQQKEKTWVELPSSASSILAHMPDGRHLKLAISDGEKGRYPIENADSYSFFLDNGKNAAVVTYKEMCR